MSSHSPESEYTWPPAVVGFDMPSTTAIERESGEPSMVAFLSSRPDHYWIEVFASEVGAFILQHQLQALRLDVQCLVATGAATKLRSLTADLRNFVHRVSRLSLQRRVIDRIAADDDSSRDVVENDAAQRDLDVVSHTPSVSAILAAVARVTGMRLVAVARVSETRWTACAVYDMIDFGLHQGQDLVLETTICSEIRKHGKPVMFSHASQHPVFSRHRTPALYGFESYISVPILRENGQFFGTLCALDTEPRLLDQVMVQTVERYARAIAAEIDAVAI
ncbi:GAF domain-containing protein [Dyella sp. C9]|uniref:GAF domain-containing protein n=1 Tax=Dyella sp. C9 TaxID=2202154 RepID=UPI0018E5995A|nr:GAF domain-containing protein [Dyella sp. C9]